VPQIEAFAKKEGLPLGDGWKVEIAKTAKARLQRNNDLRAREPEAIAKWVELFNRFDS